MSDAAIVSYMKIVIIGGSGLIGSKADHDDLHNS
jgi:hypothetical protein